MRAISFKRRHVGFVLGIALFVAAFVQLSLLNARVSRETYVVHAAR